MRETAAPVKIDDALKYGWLSRKRWNVLDLITIFARSTVPAFLVAEIDVTEIESLRERLKSRGNRVTITAILLKAISVIQLSHPSSRSFRLSWGKRVTPEEPVAGFTVERQIGDDPVVFFANIPGAHRKSLSEIGAELERYGNSPVNEVPQLNKEVMLTHLPWVFRQVGIWIGRGIPALRQSVNPATFGLTSLGKFGISHVIAPNVSTCIFGVGSVEQRVQAGSDDKIEIRKMMTLTLAADSSVMSLNEAAQVVDDLKQLLESGLTDDFNLSDEELIDQKSRALESAGVTPSDS